MTHETASAYLGGMIDGEGSVEARPRNARVTITNNNVHILARCADALAIIGVERYSLENRIRAGYVPSIRIFGHDNFVRIYEACGPFIASHKHDRLRTLAEKNNHRNGKPIK